MGSIEFVSNFVFEIFDFNAVVVAVIDLTDWAAVALVVVSGDARAVFPIDSFSEKLIFALVE